jgi:putative hemolysin
MIFGRFFALKPEEGERRMTEEEIRTIVEYSSRSGNIDEEESEMIQNVFDFSDTAVEEIMTHRTEISAINIKSTRKQIIEYVQNERFTRFPVFENDIDHIIGTLHVKDLLKFLDNAEEKFSLKKLLREPYFVPDSKKTDELFREMQQQKNHIAIVLDEYGGTAGIVTIEDLIEEIVGNIQDEYDEDEEEINQIDAYTYEIEGLTNIDDVEDELEIGLPVEDYDTISGFILGQLGRFPDKDETVSIEFNNCVFEIIETNENVITRVKVTKPQIVSDEENDS